VKQNIWAIDYVPKDLQNEVRRRMKNGELGMGQQEIAPVSALEELW